MRVLLSKNSKQILFNLLMKKHGAVSLKDLALKLNIPYKTIRNWKNGQRKYLPNNLMDEFSEKLEILDVQPNNWGQKKGGNAGRENKIKNLKKLWSDPKFSNLISKIGKKNIFILNKKIKEDENYRKFIRKKIKSLKNKKRQFQSELLELKNRSYFKNNKISLDNSGVLFSKSDKIKNIKLPLETTPKLAEEIGIHLGDGCLSIHKNYFSVKTNKKEREYMLNFLFPLYKELYGLNLKLMELESVVGFEVYSQALFEFKNKVLNIPFGNKVNRITVPPLILESRNKEIYSSFVRGIFDTDGCVHLVKSKNNYPVITFTIKSEPFIKEVGKMLEIMGFIPYLGKYVISLNGYVMLEKWIKEIGSNNPKNMAKLEQASSSTWIE